MFFCLFAFLFVKLIHRNIRTIEFERTTALVLRQTDIGIFDVDMRIEAGFDDTLGIFTFSAVPALDLRTVAIDASTTMDGVDFAYMP
jgi:hypothetical protein